MDCTVCGGDNRDGARFCRQCGSALAQLPAGDATPPDAGLPVGAGGEALPPQGEEAGDGGPGPRPEPVAEPAAPAPGEAPLALPEADLLVSSSPADAPIEGSEVPAPAPLSPGTVVAGRYLVLGPLDGEPPGPGYAARDLCRCWQCGYEANAPDDAFCAQCGAALERKLSVRLLPVGESQPAPAADEAVAPHLSVDGRLFEVVTDQPPADKPSTPEAAWRRVVGYRTDVGRTRGLNEDSLLVLDLVQAGQAAAGHSLGFYAVADGMGGHEGGEVASKLALETLASEVLRRIVLPELGGEALDDEDLVARLAQAAHQANDAVFLARQKRGNDMGTTLTVALLRDRLLALAHVGDSRAYRWGAQGLQQLTTDHSVIASMVAAGKAAPEEVYTHPHRSVVYRCVGDRPVVEVDSAALAWDPADRLLLCSDGLWEMIRAEGIADGLMQEADPQAACDLLVGRANAAGGEDNISVIVVHMEAT